MMGGYKHQSNVNVLFVSDWAFSYGIFVQSIKLHHQTHGYIKVKVKKRY